MAVPATPQIEADKRLLQFKTYEDYLDSLVSPQDLCNLQSTVVSRTIAELGYRSSGETLSRAAFERRLAAVIAYLYPSFKPYELASEGLKASDPLQQELALRERPNRVGILATIIFVRHYTTTGFEVSGYIDYTQRLKTEDWKPFFRAGKRFWPLHDDLGYYHWRIGKNTSNDSFNYKVMCGCKKAGNICTAVCNNCHGDCLNGATTIDDENEDVDDEEMALTRSRPSFRAESLDFEVLVDPFHYPDTTDEAIPSTSHAKKKLRT